MTSTTASDEATCRIVLPDHTIIIPAGAHSLSGFRDWVYSEGFPEQGRICFLNHEVFVDMSPEELETHVKVKIEVGRVLTNLNKKEKLGEFYGDGALYTNEAANIST